MSRHGALRAVLALATTVALAACGASGKGAASVTRRTGSAPSTPTALATSSPAGPALGNPKDCPLGSLAAAHKPVELTFWQLDTGVVGQTIASLVARYNASQSAVHVNTVVQTDPLKFFAALQSGRLPDLVQSDGIFFLQQGIDSGAVVPAGACLAADHADVSDFLPRALSAYTVDKTLWAMPFSQNTYVLFYNRKAFVAAGLDPAKPPTTIDEVHTDSLAIMKSHYTHHGVSWESNNGVLSAMLSKSGQEMVDHDNGRSGRATHLTIDNQVGRKAFHSLHDMIADGTAIPAGDDQTALLAVGNRDSAMAIGASSSSLGDIQDAMRKQSFPGVEVGMAPLPALVPTTAGGANFRGNPLYIVKGHDRAKVEAAYRFSLWLSEPDQQATLHLASGTVPVRRSVATRADVLARWAANPLYRVTYDDLSAPGTPPGGGAAVYGPTQQIADAITNEWTSVALSHADPDKALAQTVKDSDAALANYLQELGGGQ